MKSATIPALAALLALAGPAFADGAVPPPARYQTPAQIQAATAAVGYQTADQVAAAVAARMPGAGAVVPPPVNATGATGTSALYARADHTHVSSILKAVVPTDANGQVSWTYPQINGAAAFTAAPVVQVTVETASGQPYVALITSNTASALTVKVLRAQQLPTNLVNALLSGVFNVFGGTVGAGVPVHIYAAKATQ